MNTLQRNIADLIPGPKTWVLLKLSHVYRANCHWSKIATMTYFSFVLQANHDFLQNARGLEKNMVNIMVFYDKSGL